MKRPRSRTGRSISECYSCIPSRRPGVKLMYTMFDWHSVTAAGTWDGALSPPAEDDTTVSSLSSSSSSHRASFTHRCWEQTSFCLLWSTYLTTNNKQDSGCHSASPNKQLLRAFSINSPLSCKTRALKWWEAPQVFTACAKRIRWCEAIQNTATVTVLQITTLEWCN